LIAFSTLEPVLLLELGGKFLGIRFSVVLAWMTNIAANKTSTCAANDIYAGLSLASQYNGFIKNALNAKRGEIKSQK
jgi:hypothetical protein